MYRHDIAVQIIKPPWKCDAMNRFSERNSKGHEVVKYKRSITVPHGPLTLSAHLVDKGFSVEILDEIALEPGETERRLENSLKNKNPLCIGITSMTGEQIKRGKN